MLSALLTCRRVLLAITDHLRFLPPLLTRVVVGVVFMSTGWGKLHNLPGLVDFFRELGIPAPEFQAPLVATTELVGGTLIVLGLGARLAAVPLMCTMVVATATAVWPQAEGLLDLLGKVEILYFTLFLWIAVAGPGAVSVDAVLLRWLERMPMSAYAVAPASQR